MNEYDLKVYVNLKSIPLLDQRLKNLEPFIRVYSSERRNLIIAMQNPEEGMKMVAELDEKLEGLRLEMETILMAKEILTGNYK